MAKQGVIFDMDGVLIDSYEAHHESWRTLGRRHGLEIDEETFASVFGRTSRDIIRGLWGTRVSDAEVPAWDEEKEAAYREIIEKRFPVMDGAEELLAALHEAGFALAIGSSGPPENVAVVLRHLAAGKHFAATVTGKEVTKGKPDPQVFLKAAGKLGLSPGQCAVVEDAPAGLEAARRAGMSPIAITGTAARETLAPLAAIMVDSLRELSPAGIAKLIDDRRVD